MDTVNFPTPGLRKCEDCGRVPMYVTFENGKHSITCRCGKKTDELDDSDDAIKQWNKKDEKTNNRRSFLGRKL